MNNTTSTLSYLIIPKAEILATADYNLTASRYRKQEAMQSSKWEMVELGEVCEVITPPKKILRSNYLTRRTS